MTSDTALAYCVTPCPTSAPYRSLGAGKSRARRPQNAAKSTSMSRIWHETLYMDGSGEVRSIQGLTTPKRCRT